MFLNLIGSCQRRKESGYQSKSLVQVESLRRGKRQRRSTRKKGVKPDKMNIYMLLVLMTVLGTGECVV